VSQSGHRLVEVHHRHLRVGVVGSLSEKCPRGQLGKSPTEHASARWCPATFPAGNSSSDGKQAQIQKHSSTERPWHTQPTHTQTNPSNNHDAHNKTKRAGRTNLAPGNTLVGWGQHPTEHRDAEHMDAVEGDRHAWNPEQPVGRNLDLQGDRPPWKGPCCQGVPVGPTERDIHHGGPCCSPCHDSWKGCRSVGWKGSRLGPGGAWGTLLQQPTWKPPPEEGRRIPIGGQRGRGQLEPAQILERLAREGVEPWGQGYLGKGHCPGGGRGAKEEQFTTKPRS
jgi:hypothetical protein